MTTSDDPWGPVPDADPLDELASALVDGEAGDEEVARADDPEVADRVATFEAVARRVAEPVAPAADADRDAAIRAALAAAPSAVPSLDAARDRRAGRRGLPQWLPGVAAVAAVVVGFGLLVAALPDGDGGDETAGAGDAATSEAAEGAETFDTAADDADSGAAGGEAQSAAGSLPDAARALGTFDDPASLEDALRLRRTASSAEADEEQGGDEGADGNASFRTSFAACGVAPDRVVTDLWVARYVGREVVVAVFAAQTDGTVDYAVVDVESCATVTAGEL